ncbi:exported hypothetical protein [Flavobacterium sp. 9AF]|uniref:hypothetical protein n=1 Tax=Flavobacterium sp. 9AF TaxID=2653142 RepID=UPI0012EF1C94|nr:hypothetical protein [Flavobacterium sp. 9AF]VXB01263.1 exported hypothetical protein [Flavobacterium sp. 9AF]
MKKAMLIVSLLIFSTQAIQAQKKSAKKSAKKSQAYEIGLGSQVNLSNGSSFGIYSTGAHQFSDEILAGIKLGSQFETGTSNFEVGAFGRYLFNNFFGGAGLTYSHSSYEVETGNYNGFEVEYSTEKITASGVYLTLEPGYRYFFNDNFGIDSGLNINFSFSNGGGTWVGLRLGGLYRF